MTDHQWLELSEVIKKQNIITTIIITLPYVRILTPGWIKIHRLTSPDQFQLAAEVRNAPSQTALSKKIGCEGGHVWLHAPIIEILIISMLLIRCFLNTNERIRGTI